LHAAPVSSSILNTTMRHSFQTAQWVPYPVTKVFAIFANPTNLPRLMPAWQRPYIEKMTIILPPSNGEEPESAATRAGTGSTITIRFRPFPLSPIFWRWEAKIVEFQWNEHFCDEQTEGPFAYWRHCHRLSRETKDGHAGTTVTDDLIYELPLGIFSEPAHALVIRKQIEAIFRYRQQRLLELL
jgi:ligand-binding SRPBCC domain-containing protein